ncbi:class I SAM-dependent methyltransferase [Methylocapsa acidiphila]|uniref:class I SAM-dependent methyltransferase n=1 Tax=Methylocapsa acidiphila TaxID=133552 RepID=UPI0004166CDA|nr:class I SAM-dependent methyltransferase [Methylocapsa acidiphila]
MNHQATARAERLFSGPIGAEYDMLKLICPAAAAMSLRVGDFVASLPARPNRTLDLFEIGCGTGVTTQALLHSRSDLTIAAIDNEPTMLAQAQGNLAGFLGQGRVTLFETDALSGLRSLPAESVDVVASAYAIHNFLDDYRSLALAEAFRVLRPGGFFVNGDRYALDDAAEHTRQTQAEARHYFKTFAAIGRHDLLEQWIIHLFSDESSEHLMRLGPALATMQAVGFEAVEVPFREGVNALLTAVKPAP